MDMLTWKTRTTVPQTLAALSALGMVMVTLAAVQAQQTASTAPLTAMDQIEIQQLVAQAHDSLYTGAGNGYAYADLFTADGAFDKAVGREQLAAFARGGRKGTRSLSTNVIIEASAGGATGKQYEVVVNFVQGPKPVSFGATGRYEDVYVKTSNGWRFKKREFLTSIPTSEASKAIVRATPPAPGQAAPPPTPASVPLQPRAKGTTGSTLTPQDYLDIQKLVASYGHALDSGIGREDNGETYAGLFAPDGVFGRPYTTGHDPMVRLAHTQPHGRQYIRHFLTNMVIDAAPEGAVGRQYLVVIDIEEGGKPTSVLIGGHYEDIYVKTPAGWRFKSRTLYPARTGNADQAQAAPAAR
jgi:actinorhodin biosynthesis protein ActVIA